MMPYAINPSDKYKPYDKVIINHSNDYTIGKEQIVTLLHKYNHSSWIALLPEDSLLGVEMSLEYVSNYHINLELIGRKRLDVNELYVVGFAVKQPCRLCEKRKHQ